MNPYKCFGHIVGLTQADCPCLDDAPPHYNVSDSGYYVDDFEYGIPLRSISSAADCGEGSIWELMKRARDEAVRDFLADLTIVIGQNNRKSFRSFTGPLANHKESHNSSIQNLGAYAGVKYVPTKYKGVMMRLTELCGFFDANGSVTVEVYSSLDFANPITTITLPTVKKKKSCVKLPQPVDLPLSHNGQKVSYYFVYATDGPRPRNIAWSCGCGTKPLIYSYMDAGGIDFDDMNDMPGMGFKSGYTNGLMPMVTIACDPTGWLCKDWDYMSDPFGRTMAMTVMYYSILKLAGFILNSNRINFFTLLKREELFAKRKSMQKKIERNMNFLVENIPSDVSDCIDCGSYRIRKGTIIT